jgi:hypothetical protein
MADRQQFTRTVDPDPELKEILEASRNIPVTEEELSEQQINFAFGLCHGQYDATELAVGLPQSACNAVLGVERQDQQPESNGKQNGE